MAFKFTIAKTSLKEGPVSPASQPQLASPKEDWADKTVSSWNEHSSFLEKSGLIKLAPPPRLDPRTIPRPESLSNASNGPSPLVKNIAMGFVLAVGVGFGLYSNGVLDPFLKPLGFGVGDEIANAPGNTLRPIARRAAAAVAPAPAPAATEAATEAAASNVPLVDPFAPPVDPQQPVAAQTAQVPAPQTAPRVPANAVPAPPAQTLPEK